ncbi:unnamed protein product, partial [marine sediment metagenome]
SKKDLTGAIERVNVFRMDDFPRERRRVSVMCMPTAMKKGNVGGRLEGDGRRLLIYILKNNND